MNKNKFSVEERQSLKGLKDDTIICSADNGKTVVVEDTDVYSLRTYDATTN